MAFKLMNIFLLSIIYCALTQAAPMLSTSNDHHTTAGVRLRRQSMFPGKPVIAQEIKPTNSRVCPIYGDGQCSKIQDVLCASDMFSNEFRRLKQAKRHEASTQSVGSCAMYESDDTNNLKSLYEDIQTLSSIFYQVGEEFNFPNFPQAQCQLQTINSHLETTINYFCEFSNENCSDVEYVCNDTFQQNSVFNVTGDSFEKDCYLNLLRFLSQSLKHLHRYLKLDINSKCDMESCWRNTSTHNENSLESFGAILKERQQSLPSPLMTYNEVQCRPINVVNSSTFILYTSVVNTTHKLSALPSQEDLVSQLNALHILPILKQYVEHVVDDSDMSEFNGLNVIVPISPQEGPKDVEVASCLVTRLRITYEILLHDKLRHQWSMIDRTSDTGCY